MKPVWLIALLWLGLPATGTAQTTTDARFGVTLRGIGLGEFQLSQTTGATAYGAAARFASTGLAGVIRPVSFTMQASGTRRGAQALPQRYAETVRVGGENAAAQLDYRNGIPVLSGTKLQSEDNPPVAPARTRGTLDPMTAMYLVLRDQPRADLCRFDLRIFDGVRLSRITGAPAAQEDNAVTCVARYDRLAGYPAEQIAEATRFTLSLRYSGTPARMQFQSVAFGSTLGPIRMVRR